MKRLIKKAETITHDFISPYWLLIENPETYGMNVSEPIEHYEREANSFMKNDFEKVKPIIIENLKDDGITSIMNMKVDLKNGKLTTTVTFNEEPDKATLDKVANELESQYADGWGEGLEQDPFMVDEDIIEVEYEDEDGEYYTERENVKYDVCLKLWNFDGFSIRY